MKALELKDLEGIEITKYYVNQILVNNKYNQEVITEYYHQLQQEFQYINLQNKIDNISNCNSWWLLDYYKQQKVKDFKKTNLCKDKFCNNCKKVKNILNNAKHYLLFFSHSVVSDSVQPHGLQQPGIPILHYLMEFAQTHVY